MDWKTKKKTNKSAAFYLGRGGNGKVVLSLLYMHYYRRERKEKEVSESAGN